MEAQVGSVIFAWPKPTPAIETLDQRLSRILALLQAIDAGELLSALPECPIAQSDHQQAQTLIATAEIQLARLIDDLRPANAELAKSPQLPF